MTPRDVPARTPDAESARIWQDRVLCALDALATLPAEATTTRTKEMVGARFATYFTADARLYEGKRPAWEREVDDAVKVLLARKALAETPSPADGQDTVLRITKSGRLELEGACDRGIAGTAHSDTSMSEPAAAAASFDTWVGYSPQPDLPGVITPALREELYPQPFQIMGDVQIIGQAGQDPVGDLQYRGVQITNPFIVSSHGLPWGGQARRPLTWQDPFSISIEQLQEPEKDDPASADFGEAQTPSDAVDPPRPIVIELNLGFGSGLDDARRRCVELWQMVQGPAEPLRIADQYMAGDLTRAQMEGIVAADAATKGWPQRAIIHIWPDFTVDTQLDASTATIKALPAQRSFGAFGDKIVWAVIDSGIQADHPHFTGYHTLDDPVVRDLHRDFTGNFTDHSGALTDQTGHGTHVAGIIAGGLNHWQPPSDQTGIVAAEKRFNPSARGDSEPILQPRDVDNPELLAGVAPRAKLVSLKVLARDKDPDARTRRVLQALEYVRSVNGSGDKTLRIHGVNLSLGYPYGAQWACGQTPLCVAVDNLVRSGVVVVVAAGNTGYVTHNPLLTEVRKFSAGMTINDPGNAAKAITVGSTARQAPHTNGISHFSSRGPTGDGRLKPDLVAPGEDILSAAAGENFDSVARIFKCGLPPDAAVYVEQSGTSQAAPHVSGAIAAYLSVQRELIGQPEEVKRIFMDTATSLRRDPNCQGAGMVDLMRALQAQ